MATPAALSYDQTDLLDVERIRADFPVLQRTVNGVPLIYLDNAATSQKPAVVIQAIENYYRSYNANVHRGVHTLSEEATTLYEGARHKVAQFINAPSANQHVALRGALRRDDGSVGDDEIDVHRNPSQRSNSREMTMRRISDVPPPISASLESRKWRCMSNSIR